MANSQIRFKTPVDVILFVRECLQASDADRLYGAAREETDEFWRQTIFDDLRCLDQTESLETVFLREERFPTNQTEYKMGGHSTRTRHLHLDLVRINRTWRLKAIWKCR